jgi:hypothetical protein
VLRPKPLRPSGFFLQHAFLIGIRQHEVAQIAHVLRRPVRAVLVVVSVAQQEAQKALLRALQVVHRVGSGPADVAHRLVAGGRNPDRGGVAVAVELGELHGVAPVGLDPLARLALRLGGRDHHALHAEVEEAPRQHKAGRPGLVADLQVPELGSEFLGDLAQGALDVLDRGRALPIVDGILPLPGRRVAIAIFSLWTSSPR